MKSNRDIYTPEDYSEWMARTKSKDQEFAQKIIEERPELRIKELLDGRREEPRWAITINSAARLLGINVKTLRRLLEDDFDTSFEQVRPTINGHKYLWLDDVLNYARKMIEQE